MIKINVLKKDDQVEKIAITGHANYLESGKDIVCAAVSSIAITTVNAIIRLDEKALNVALDDDLIIKVLKHDKTIDILLTNMLELFKELQMQYPKNIKII